MNRREFLELGIGAGCIDPSLLSTTTALPLRDFSSPLPPVSGGDITIRDYLTRAATRITQNSLHDIRTKSDFDKRIAARRQKWEQMTSLPSLLPANMRGTVPVHVTGTVQRTGYRIEKLHYESLPGLHVTANLYIPDRIQGKAPAVLYVCGHAPKQKVAYQAHARRFAQLGFVTLIAETVQLGEAPGFHHGNYREGWWNWYSRGYAPSAIEMVNGMRGLDLLCQLPDVDPERLGVTGISGGGASTWWIAAGDPRIKAAATCCGTATLQAHIAERLIDGHCDCMWWINTAQWDMADVGTLIAPRPFMIASADRDSIFSIESIRVVHSQLRKLYEALGHGENLKLVEYAGNHGYQAPGRTAIFSWFVKHLMGRDVAPDKVGDLDESPEKQESEETLKVYVNGMPDRNRAITIHDEALIPAAAPVIATKEEHLLKRRALIEQLSQTSFAHIPPKRLAPAPQIDFRWAVGSPPAGSPPETRPAEGFRFSYLFDDGWRLHGTFNPVPGTAADLPVVIAVRNPGDERNAGESLAGSVPASARVVLDLPGTGDTAWGDELNWHLRRAAAWTGRTIASIRVHALMQGIDAVRKLPGMIGKPVALAARGEMAVVALYAALLDGNVSALHLTDPPATQNVVGRPDGKGSSPEILQCLQATDVWQVAGLLWPQHITIHGALPETYQWARDLYAKLGAPGRFVVG